jgi:hypothetical protein
MKTLALLLILTAGAVPAIAATGPETVQIGTVSHWFEPVEFMHEGHMDMVEDCTTCHHDQSPEDIISCTDCHSAVYDPSEPDVPDLKMAYHQLCVGCHQTEGATLTCVDCHARKALPAGPDLKDAHIR